MTATPITERLMGGTGDVMLSQNQWPMPSWLDSVPEDERDATKLRILLSLAAIYASECGTASRLAECLGAGPSAILQAKARGKISGEMAVKLEALLGRELFPRELFRPDLFLIGAE